MVVECCRGSRYGECKQMIVREIRLTVNFNKIRSDLHSTCLVGRNAKPFRVICLAVTMIGLGFWGKCRVYGCLILHDYQPSFVRHLWLLLLDEPFHSLRTYIGALAPLLELCSVSSSWVWDARVIHRDDRRWVCSSIPILRDTLYVELSPLGSAA